MHILWFLAILFFIIISRVIYTRYAPIIGVPCIESHHYQKEDVILVDIRDYQESANDEIEDAMVIPVAYLRRYYKEIPCKSIYIIASSHLEKNLAIRYLKAKGFYVQGYFLTTCECEDKIENCI